MTAAELQVPTLSFTQCSIPSTLVFTDGALGAAGLPIDHIRTSIIDKPRQVRTTRQAWKTGQARTTGVPSRFDRVS